LQPRRRSESLINLTCGKLPLGKLYIWDVANSEVVFGKIYPYIATLNIFFFAKSLNEPFNGNIQDIIH